MYSWALVWLYDNMTAHINLQYGNNVITMLWLNYSQLNCSDLKLYVKLLYVKLSNDGYYLYTILQMNMSLLTSYVECFFSYIFCPHPYLINKIMWLKLQFTLCATTQKPNQSHLFHFLLKDNQRESKMTFHCVFKTEFTTLLSFHNVHAPVSANASKTI